MVWYHDLKAKFCTKHGVLLQDRDEIVEYDAQTGKSTIIHIKIICWVCEQKGRV